MARAKKKAIWCDTPRRRGLCRGRAMEETGTCATARQVAGGHDSCTTDAARTSPARYFGHKDDSVTSGPATVGQIGGAAPVVPPVVAWNVKPNRGKFVGETVVPRG